MNELMRQTNSFLRVRELTGRRTREGRTRRTRSRQPGKLRSAAATIASWALSASVRSLVFLGSGTTSVSLLVLVVCCFTCDLHAVSHASWTVQFLRIHSATMVVPDSAWFSNRGRSDHDESHRITLIAMRGYTTDLYEASTVSSMGEHDASFLCAAGFSRSCGQTYLVPH